MVCTEFFSQPAFTRNFKTSLEKNQLLSIFPKGAYGVRTRKMPKFVVSWKATREKNNAKLYFYCKPIAGCFNLFSYPGFFLSLHFAASSILNGEDLFPFITHHRSLIVDYMRKLWICVIFQRNAMAIYARNPNRRKSLRIRKRCIECLWRAWSP